VAKSKKNTAAQAQVQAENEVQNPQAESQAKKRLEQSKRTVQKKPKKYRSLSRFIEVFEFKGTRYTIHPNSVAENLPEDAPQVQRLIKSGRLVEVK